MNLRMLGNPVSLLFLTQGYITRLTSAVWTVLQHSISRAASISPAGRWCSEFNGWDENAILSRPARLISWNRLIEETSILNLQVNLLWKRARGLSPLIVASFVIPWLCAFILFLKLLKVKAPSWRRQKAGKASRLSTSSMITMHAAFVIAIIYTIIYTKCEITRVTSNAICLESNCTKTSENIKTESVSHYSSRSIYFAACLNDDWHVGSHVHAGRTIAAASALQISSHQVGMKIACSSQAKSDSYWGEQSRMPYPNSFHPSSNHHSIVQNFLLQPTVEKREHNRR